MEFLRNCELKRGTIVLLLLGKLYVVHGLFVKYDRAVGASPINTLWSSNRGLKYSSSNVGKLPQ